MKGKLTLEVDERGFHMECHLLKVDEYDKAYLLYHIGKTLEVDANDFFAIGRIMATGIGENLFVNGEITQIDFSNIPKPNKGGAIDV